jgi:hypothetical protein
MVSQARNCTAGAGGAPRAILPSNERVWSWRRRFGRGEEFLEAEKQKEMDSIGCSRDRSQSIVYGEYGEYGAAVIGPRV